SVFLPQGYPESVSDDYMDYQIWDTMQAFCSSITGALAAQAILKGVGVGDENATVLAATMTWLIKVREATPCMILDVDSTRNGIVIYNFQMLSEKKVSVTRHCLADGNDTSSVSPIPSNSLHLK
ncbi:RUS1 family protein C16orf58, partial [Lamellibrachia satsuma]